MSAPIPTTGPLTDRTLNDAVDAIYEDLCSFAHRLCDPVLADDLVGSFVVDKVYEDSKIQLHVVQAAAGDAGSMRYLRACLRNRFRDEITAKRPATTGHLTLSQQEALFPPLQPVATDLEVKEELEQAHRLQQLDRCAARELATELEVHLRVLPGRWDEAYGRLTARQQRMVALRFDGVSHKAIAAELGMTHAAARTTWSRLRKKLERVLDQPEGALELLKLMVSGLTLAEAAAALDLEIGPTREAMELAFRIVRVICTDGRRGKK